MTSAGRSLGVSLSFEGASSGLSGPLHASRGHLQPPFARSQRCTSFRLLISRPFSVNHSRTARTLPRHQQTTRITIKLTGGPPRRTSIPKSAPTKNYLFLAYHQPATLRSSTPSLHGRPLLHQSHRTARGFVQLNSFRSARRFHLSFFFSTLTLGETRKESYSLDA